MPFVERFFEPFFYFFDPSKRVFALYSLSSLILALLVLLRHRSLKQSLSDLFNKKLWLHPSSKVDFQFLFFNAAVRAVLFIFVSFSSLQVARWTMKFMNRHWPNFQTWGGDYSKHVLIYALLSFVILDFSRFLQHYLFHKIPILWRFHRIHHFAQVLSPVTLYRTHPLESIVSSFRSILVIGVVSGFYLFATRSMISGYEILGVNFLDFAFNIFGSNLRHSHIWLSFGPLNYLFMSPAQHQIHHSRAEKHHDRNFGFALSLWDHLFGSFYQVRRKEFLIFGLRGENIQNFSGQIFSPFLGNGSRATKRSI